MDKELKSLLDSMGVGRRDFLAGATLVAGFALAAQPVGAQAIATPAQGLKEGMASFPSNGTSVPVYMARPEAGSKWPIVLVIQEIFGVHEHIKDVCRRLAGLGYMAVAPELYVRQGDPKTAPDIPSIMQNIVPKVPDAQVMADLDAAADWAAAQGGDANRLAITGFCWGGRIVWLYAAHNPRLKAGVAWYGRLVGTVGENTPRHPQDIAAQIKAPVLGLYGGADPGIPQETVEQMRELLKGATKKAEIVVYPDAPHAFHADYRPSYRKEPAEDGWKRLQAWLKVNGV
ncbi:MAG: dienelactone hydrolase family protein [Alphaproteobacteria bacterium]|nr:dienelactone hydrolase family protein [Alphaproteobacteria bacterium]